MYSIEQNVGVSKCVRTKRFEIQVQIIYQVSIQERMCFIGKNLTVQFQQQEQQNKKSREDIQSIQSDQDIA